MYNTEPVEELVSAFELFRTQFPIIDQWLARGLLKQTHLSYAAKDGRRASIISVQQAEKLIKLYADPRSVRGKLSDVICKLSDLGTQEYEIYILPIDADVLYKKIISQLAAISQIPQRKRLEKQEKTLAILPVLRKLAPFITGEDVRYHEFMVLTKRLRQYINTDHQHAEILVKQYFQHYFTSQNYSIINMTTRNKIGGNQLGFVLDIESALHDLSLNKMTYFVKTHQYGSQVGSRSNSGAVNVLEIFVYKLLELIGIGVKAHFITDKLSPEGLLIATQAADYTKTAYKQKQFDKYELLEKPFNTLLEKGRHLTITAAKAIWTIEILSHLLGLSDALTNNGNFGRIMRNIPGKIDSSYEKWKLIDFRLEEERIFQRTKDVFTILIKADYKDSFSGMLQKILYGSSYEERVTSLIMAVKALNINRKSQSGGFKLNFNKASDLALEFTRAYIKTECTHNFGLSSEQLDTALIEYHKRIKEDFVHLVTQCDAYKGILITLC